MYEWMYQQLTSCFVSLTPYYKRLDIRIKDTVYPFIPHFKATLPCKPKAVFTSFTRREILPFAFARQRFDPRLSLICRPSLATDWAPLALESRNCHPLEVVDRGSETQLQVEGNLNPGKRETLTQCRSTINSPLGQRLVFAGK